MATPSPDEPDPNAAREAFIARMKQRAGQARASGQSPEQAQAAMQALAREEMRQRAPQLAARARSWWIGLRRFVIVGLLALLAAGSLALAVEHRYAAPLCERHGAAQQLRYEGLSYPALGNSSSSTSSVYGRCRFRRADGSSDSVSLERLDPRGLVAFAAAVALELELTIPVAFVLIALLAAALGIFRKI